MKADRNCLRMKKKDLVKEWVEKWKNKGFKKHIFDGSTYLFPPLVKRPRCFTYNPKEGCLYCGNKTFKYYSIVCNKKYYQCEKCRGINH